MTLATIADADAEWAHNVGADRPQQAWILSDRDCWYRNPAYTGPEVPHPESGYFDFEEADSSIEPMSDEALASLSKQGEADDIWDNDIPF